MYRANVVSIKRYRRSRDDAELNVEWDRLARLADEAWSWRDPDALTALDECIAQLLRRLRTDWRI